MYESPLTSPTTNNPFNRDFQTRGAEMQTDLKDTLRSFRDTLAFSFQTLNLTLASMNNSVQALGTKIGQLSPGIGGQYIPANPHDNAYYGSLSKAYAQFAGSQNYAGMLTANIPYNVSPLEFWKERQTEMAFRHGSGALALGASAVEEIGTMFGGNYLGGKMARALGMTGTWAKIGMGLPAGMAISAMAGAYFDPFVAAGQEHNRDVAAIKRMSARFSNPFTIRQAQQATRGIEQLAYNELWNTTTLDSRLNMSGFRDLTMMGLQGNMFHGTSPDELAKQVSAASNIVKFLTGVMGNKDVQETMQMVKQLKDMGINVFQSVGAAQTMGLNAFKYGKIMGVDSGSLINAAANMSTAAFGQYGMPAFVGMNPAMRSLAFTQEAEKRGILTPAEIAAGGGIQAMGSRMVQMQANMLANTGIGGAMLYAGWDGGRGFDLNRFKAANANGYFNMLGGATGNITSQGIGGIARALVNRNNILASAANTPGGIEALLDQTLAGQIDVIKGIAGENASLDDQIAVAAIMLTQQNPGLDMGTAKLMATKVLRPSVARNMESSANRQLALGALEDARARNSPGRMLEAPGEMWDRFKGSLYRNLIQRPAAALTDKFTNALDFGYESKLINDDRLLAADRYDMYQWAFDGYGKRSMPEGVLNFYSEEDLRAANKQLRSRTGFEWEHSFRRGTNFVTDAFSSMSRNQLEDRLFVNSASANQDLWRRIASKDRMSKLEARSMASRFLREGVDQGAIDSVFDQYAANATGWDPLRAATDVLYNFSSDKEWLQNRAAVGRASLSDALNMDNEALARQVYGNAFVDTKIKAGAGRGADFTLNMTADEIFTTLNAADARGNIERIANKIKWHSGKQVSAGIADRMAGIKHYGNKMTTVYSAGMGNEAEALAEANASLRDINRMMLSSSGYTGGLSIAVNKANEVFDSIGLSKEILGDVVSSGSIEDLQALAHLASKMQYFGAELSNEDYARINKMSSYGKRAAQSLVDNAPNKDGVFTGSRKYTESDYIGFMKNAISGHVAGGISDQLKGYGIDVDKDQVAKWYTGEGSGVMDFIETTDVKGNNAEWRAIQQRAGYLKNASNEELTMHLRGILSDSALTDMYGNDGISDDTERTKALQQLGLHLMSSTAEQDKAKTAAAASVKKSAIDSAVDTVGQAKPYVRVQVVDDEIKTERARLEREVTMNKLKTSAAEFASTWSDNKKKELSKDN